MILITINEAVTFALLIIMSGNNNNNNSDESTPLVGSRPMLSKNSSRSLLLRIPSSSNVQSKKSNSRPVLFHSQSATSVTSVHSNDGSVTYDSFNITKNKYTNNNASHYVSYYFPIIGWLPKYDVNSCLPGDLVAGFSLASFQIPLAISFACLAHVDIRCGLVALIVCPLVYAIFGSCRFLITGPEAAICLIMGNLVENLTHESSFPVSTFEIVAAVTFTSGLILLLSGLFRFGFLVNVVSKGLLNGFISSIGILMLVNELLVQLGLSQYFEELHESDPSTFDKLYFIVKNLDLSHALTIKISAVAFGILFVVRYLKKYLIRKNSQRFSWLNFFPEILLVVIISIVLSNHYKWNKDGVAVVGKYFEDVQNSDSPIEMPFFKFKLIKKVFATAFVCSIIGFFESNTATKSLETLLNVNYSSNRELVALGICNLIGSVFSIVPSFGGYGRSKVNSLTAKTQLSGIILSFITLIFYVFFLSIFYYLPECILACVISIVAISLIEESPENLKFYWKIGGIDEIAVFTVIVLATLFWSPEIGISVGIGMSLIKIVKFSTRTKIQILGRVPKTNVFRNADELIEETFENFKKKKSNLDDDIEQVSSQLENVENCLVVKITEPLIFANSNELKLRLNRIEKYGSLNVHPSQPALTTSVKYIIVDCKNMTDLDSSATLTLYEIVLNYYKHDFIILFTRIPFDLKLRKMFVESGITKLVKKALEKHGGILFSQPTSGPHDGSTSGIHAFNSIKDNSSENLMSMSYSIGLGDGFCTSIDDALKLVSECEARKNRIIASRPYI